MRKPNPEPTLRASRRDGRLVVFGSEIVLQRPSKREYDAAIRPYAHELGRLAHSWNNLTEELGFIFWRITGIPDAKVSFAIWHKQVSDRTQREMLKAALGVQKGIAGDLKKSDDIAWLVDLVDRVVGSRNDAIHVPMMVWKLPDGEVIARPNWFSQNPKALPYAADQLINRIQSSRQFLAVLVDFAKDINGALEAPQKYAWPDRPRLPQLTPVRGLKSQKRKKP